jgi:hypothetical protein
MQHHHAVGHDADRNLSQAVTSPRTPSDPLATVELSPLVCATLSRLESVAEATTSVTAPSASGRFAFASSALVAGAACGSVLASYFLL